MHRALTSFNYDVILAQNGREAVEMADSQLPELIIMDIMMPVLDGYEAARLIRENPKTKALPILGITASFNPEARVKSLASGFDDLIFKPFPIGDLKAIVAKMLKRQSM
jgi:CheY-like chemotaxis protein